MSRLAPVKVMQPWSGRPARFQPDYVTASECALAFARPLVTGFITFGEIEDRLISYLAGPDYERELMARQEAEAFITAAARVYEATRNA